MGRFTNPRDLYFGEGARHEVKNLKGKKAIIVSGGSSMRRGGFLQDVENDLKEGGFEVKLFEGVESDPSIETVMKGAEAMREFEPDWIIAIGGGSPIDAAKAMWVFYEYPEESFDNIIQPFSFPELRQKAHFLRHLLYLRHRYRGHRVLRHYRLRQGHQVPAGRLQHHP
mgnify:CR=1 FL=1